MPPSLSLPNATHTHQRTTLPVRASPVLRLLCAQVICRTNSTRTGTVTYKYGIYLPKYLPIGIIQIKPPLASGRASHINHMTFADRVRPRRKQRIVGFRVPQVNMLLCAYPWYLGPESV